MIYDNDDLVEYDARVYRANANNYVRLETANPDDYEYFSITDYDAMRKIPRHHDCINPYNILKPSQFTVDNQYIYSNSVGDGPIINGLSSLVKVQAGSGPNVSYTFATIDIELERNYS